jgi:chromatin segregation and condensation protein Rec8/ScpA/Scc1 (kleisin family)
VAGLELSREGTLALEQQDGVGEIRVATTGEAAVYAAM